MTMRIADIRRGVYDAEVDDVDEFQASICSGSLMLCHSAADAMGLLAVVYPEAYLVVVHTFRYTRIRPVEQVLVHDSREAEVVRGGKAI